MKKITFSLFLFLSLLLNAQISVGARHILGMEKFKKEVIQKISKVKKTVFVLSNIYTNEEYESILKDSWNITSCEIVKSKDFNISNYLDEEDGLLITRLEGYKVIKDYRVTSVRIHIGTKYYDTKPISNEVKKISDKLSDKKKKKKFDKIIRENAYHVSRIVLYPKDGFINKVIIGEMDDIVDSMFNEDIYFNYDLGFLKNYFQKISSLILSKKEYWLYEEKGFTSEIIKLKTEKLYVPEYVGVKYGPWSGIEESADDEYLKGAFEKYNYEIEIISKNDLSRKIINSEEFYYFRYVRRNNEMFINIVNSKTGDIIYRDYMGGLSYNIKDKHIEAINKSVEKGIKKASKK